MVATTGYEKLQQAEVGVVVEYSAPTQRPWTRFFGIALKTVIFAFAVYGLVASSITAVSTIIPSLTGSYHPYIRWGYIHTPNRLSCRCGRTLEEAKANGCSYDSHALAWLPPHCQDQELLAEWEQSGDGPNGEWQYWADRNGTIPLTLDEVAALGGKPIDEGWFWMTQAWHIRHCAFAWRKLARSPVTGVTVERSTSGIHHIEHCEKEFLRQVDGSIIMTKAGVSLDADYQETRHMAEEDYWEIPSEPSY